MRPEVVRTIHELAAARGPLMVATDLDGTMAPIVRRAADARVPAETLAVLERLTKAARVAVITGRDLNTARRLVPHDAIVIVGSHGLEASLTNGLLPGIDRMELGAALERVEQAVLSAVPRAFLQVERKAISTAFHFRQRPELEQPLRAALMNLPPGLRLREGRMVLEVLPDARGGKDRALRALAVHFKTRSILVMGDDQTDVAMFREAIRIRGEGVAVVIAGISGGAETPAEIHQLADVFLSSTDEAREVLECLSVALRV